VAIDRPIGERVANYRRRRGISQTADLASITDEVVEAQSLYQATNYSQERRTAVPGLPGLTERSGVGG
jgi:hypothetical protein